MWNGTAATLNARPTIVSSAPTAATSPVGVPPSRAAAIGARNTDPVAPYTRETPISITAVEITETRKNFTAASAALRSPRRSPVIAKAGSETTSRATTSVTRSRDAAMVSAPVAEQSSRKFHSPSGVRPSATATVPMSATTAVPNSTTPQNTRVSPSTAKEQACAVSLRGRPTQNVACCSPQSRAANTPATTTDSTVSVAGTRAARRLRGGPAKASTSSTTIAATASTRGGATAAQSMSWVAFTTDPRGRTARPPRSARAAAPARHRAPA